METPRNILVVVDPTATEQPAVARARMLALAFGARVELFVCFVPHETTELRVDERVLERLANGLRQCGIETTVSECSAPTIHGGILQHVLRARPDLVIKDTHPHSLLRRTVLPNTDWQLIRLCPAPLLLVRQGEWSSPPRIAAAVEVALPGDKPRSFDHQLLSAAETFALALHGTLEVVHAHQPAYGAEALGAAPMAPLAGVSPDALAAETSKAVRRRFDELLASHNVPRERAVLLDGAPSEALVGYVRRTGLDVLVMGAVSRGRMYNVFVGSTTERILDLLPCDVLVMKPEGFEAPLRAAGGSQRPLDAPITG